MEMSIPEAQRMHLQFISASQAMTRFSSSRSNVRGSARVLKSVLAGLIFLLTGVGIFAAPIITTNVTSAIGPYFFFDTASTGGGDNTVVVFNRDITGYWTSNSTVTIKGIGWASSSGGTMATNATVTFIDLGPDGIFGTSDDVPVGSVSDSLVQGGAGEYAWLFDHSIVFTTSSPGLRIQITGYSNGAPAVISRKTTSGSAPNDVKLSLAGEAISPAPPLTYTLVAGNDSWPAAKRAAIISAMDEAVAHYNAYGYFPKSLTVNYDPNVPTANGSYSGRINFGGSISTRVALHEISHTLGVGTVSAWSLFNGGGTWSGPHANARVQLYNGAGTTIGCDSQHFWPYGLNYDSEDGYLTRIRAVRMVAALRWDMGIVKDSDGDGLPDDWELFYFHTLAYSGSDDFDHDGVSNLAEYNADTDPRDGISALTTTLVVNNASAAGQASYDFGPAILSAFYGANAATPNALLNNNLNYLGVNSSIVPTDSNANAINDRDGINGGADQERLRIAIKPRYGLALLTWNYSRADGPLATDGVTISGFSGGISAANPVYSAGRLTFQISAFNATVNTITFANPAASSNATLEITVADSTQAKPQFALQSLSFMNLNHPPVAANIPVSAPVGGTTIVPVTGGIYAPTDADGDAVTVSAVGLAAHGLVTFTSTNLTYTSTNLATSDSFDYVVSDGFGGMDTNTVNVTLYVPQGFNLLSSPKVMGGGNLAFAYRGLALRQYALEATPSLVPPVVWTPQWTNAATSDGWLNFTNPTGDSERFFRVRELP